MWSNATTSFNEKIQEYSRTFKARLVLADASTIDISTLTYTNGITGADTFTLGGAVSSMITGTIVGDFGKSLKGQEVTLQIGLEVTLEQFEYIPMGIYKITSSPALDGGGVSFTAYDAMYYKYSTAYTPTNGLGETITETSTDEDGNEVVTTTTLATIGQVLADIETQLGININNSCNTALMTSKVKVLGGYYIAETLGYLASALGGFVYVDRVGVVTIAPLGSRGSFQIDGDRYYNLTKGEENTVIDGVIVSTGGNDYQYGRGARVALSNPILLEASAEAMANAIIGTEYRPVTVSFLGDVRLDSNDTLTIISPSGENYTTPIMQITHTFDGGITTTVTSLEVNEVESEVGFTGSVTQQLERTQTELLDTKTLVAQKADIKELNVVKGTIEELDAKIIRTGELVADKATIGELNATKADIKELNTNLIKTNELVANKASIAELNTVKADIKVLEADSAKINSLIFGNAVGGTISTDFATAIVGQFQNGIIKSAMIESLAVDKVQSGTISTKKFRVASDDGNLAIADNTIQIKDGTRVRIQIGKDSTGDYNLSLWDANGKKLWDAKGITSDAIRDGLIDNDMINDNANIGGDKLNLPSLVKEINDSTETIKASHILYDPTKQTLDIAFQSMSQEVGDLSGNVSTLQTNHSVMNGQIKTVISATETLDRELGTVANDVATAQSTANTAKSTADSAKSTANNANTTATTANNTANTAKATADSAKATSDSANATATTAKNTADSAKSTATTAQNTANTAKNTADTAKSTADTAKNTATSALTKATSVETSLNGFKTQVSETYTTKTDFNNLSVGTRNLARNTSNEWKTWTGFNGSANYCYTMGDVYLQGLSVGDSIAYAIECEYIDIVGVTGQQTAIQIQGNGNVTGWSTGTFPTKGVQGISGSGTFELNGTLLLNAEHCKNERWIVGLRTDYIQSGTLKFRRFRVVKGNKVPKDWTPAHEDLTASIATVDGKFANYTTTTDLNSKLTQTKNEISTEVSGKYTTKTDFDNLQVGGVNLITGTKDFTGAWDFYPDWTKDGTYNGLTVMSRSGHWNGINKPFTVTQGETYTFSAYVKSTADNTGLYLIYNGQPNYVNPSFLAIGACDWKRVSITFKATGNGRINPRFEIGSEGKISVCGFKLEKGNKATDWTPAPEDVDGAIATVDKKFANYTTTTDLNTKLTQTKDQIKLEASQTYTTKTDFNNLQIGGRNLVVGSSTATVGEQWSSNGWEGTISTHNVSERTYKIFAKNGWRTHKYKLPSEYAGKQVTISFYGKLLPTSTATIKNVIQLSNATGTNPYATDKFEIVGNTSGSDDMMVVDKWLYFKKTVILNSDAQLGIMVFCQEEGKSLRTDWLIKDLKIETGNRATDWSPAPEDVQAEIDNIQVGGRNLLVGTKDFTGTWDNINVWTTDGTYKGLVVKSRTEHWSGLNQPFTVTKGEIYTFSAYVKSTARETHFYMTYNGQPYYTDRSSEAIGVCDWKRFSITFTATGNGRINPRFEIGSEGKISVCGFKLETGNRATDWSPAPEDTESTISTLRSSITANANAIELKVSKGDIISSINQTAESVKINASKVDLQGYVTVSALSGSGTTTINGANIKTGAIQSSNYVANSAGTKINLSDGTIDTKGFKVNSAGVATLTGATLTNVDLKFTSNGEDVGRIYSYAGGGGFPTLSISGQYGLDLSSSRSVKISGGNVSITGDTNISSLTVNNELNTNKIRIVSGSDASETSTGHGLQIGADNTSNIRIDPNEIVVCNNGELSEFYLNAKSIGLHANVNCKGNIQSSGGDVRAKNGDNYIRMGKGTNDAFVHNSVSGKYIQLKDNGSLQYSDTDIILASHFTGKKNTNGYIKLPNGLIIQWGSLNMTCTTGGNTVSSTVTFPVKFSSACYQIVTAVAGGAPHICSTSASDYSTSNFKYHLNRTNTTQTSCRWIAIGS